MTKDKLEKPDRPFIFDELLEAQKARNELMKWKLIIVSAIGSAGLGLLNTNGFAKPFLIIIFIPIACVYVDLLCRNLSIRSLRINIYSSIQSQSEDLSFDKGFYKFYQDTKDDVGQSLESIALIWSTIVIIIIVTGIGIVIPGEHWIKILFISSGLLCLLASLLVERKYMQQKNKLIKQKKLKKGD